MKVAIYSPLAAEGFELCHPKAEEDFERINVEINGESRCGTWRSIPMHLVRQDEGRKLLRSDAPWLGSHALILREGAAAKLQPMLEDHGELLALSCSGADLVLFNPTRIVDALDQRASSVLRFGGGRIMRISQYVFKGERLSGIDIFKIPDLRVSPTFVTNRFVEAWQHAGLEGLEFKEIWKGERGSQPRGSTG